ncbi:MAG: TrmH family RNA methyltransferase [Nocardioidaceae bacterium]
MRQARRLTRRNVRLAERRFLVEGPQAVREAFSVPECVVDVFVTSPALARYCDIAAAAASTSVPVHLCDETAVAALAGSVTPQGVVAVCRYVDVPLTSALGPDSALVAVAAHVREPGNAGSIVRCADAAGAAAVVFAGSGVDPYNDKAVRASAGSIFHLPLVVAMTVPDAVEALQARGFRILAADATATTSLDAMLDSGALAGRVAWVFGNEAWGIPDAERAAADEVVAVPIYGRAESLNVATAAAVCLYATARAQRAGAAVPPLSS